MSVLVPVLAGFAAAAIWYFTYARLIRRPTIAVEWLRAHRTGHAVLLAASLGAMASFPWWHDGDEPVDAVAAVVGVMAFGRALWGVLRNDGRYRAWRDPVD